MQNLENYIEQFLISKSRNPDTWLLHCSIQKDVYDAIHFAAMAQNHLGKRHPHQFRIKRQTLQSFADSIFHSITAIEKMSKFEELYQVIETRKVKGIGPLTIYNTAHRIGGYLNIYPTKIYLHSGTKVGAEQILGRFLKQLTLCQTELP